MQDPFSKSPGISMDAVREINRQADLADKGICSYCGRSADTPLCRVPQLHVLPLMNPSQDD